MQYTDKHDHVCARFRTKMSSNGSPNSPDVDDICCLIDEGERCQNPAASVQWTKKFAKAVGQKRLHISADINVCRWH